MVSMFVMLLFMTYNGWIVSVMPEILWYHNADFAATDASGRSWRICGLPGIWKATVFY